MEKVDYMMNTLQTLLERRNFQISELFKVLNANSEDEIIDQLFLSLNKTIEASPEKYKEYLEIYTKIVLMLIENCPNVNYKEAKKRIIKLNDKISENKPENVNELDQTSNKKDQKYFEFLEFIICDIKNLDYLEETLKKFPDIVNIKNNEGKTILSVIVDEYLKETLKDEINRDVIMYYKNALFLVKHQKQFVFNTKDRNYSNKRISKSLSKLHYQEKIYKERKKSLMNLKDLVNSAEKEKICINKLLETYNINTTFPMRIEDEINQLAKDTSSSLYPERITIDDYIITIDGEGTKEIDDAVSIRKLENGNYLLGVHIASVLGYLSYNSKAVNEAISRGNSIYIHGSNTYADRPIYKGLIPIFPYGFSLERASLIQEKPRLSNSYFFEIDNKGEIVDCKFKKTVITSNKKCTYQEINNIIKNGTSNAKVEKTVRLLDELTYKLEEKDQSKSLYVNIKNLKTDPSEVRVSTNSRSERIIGQIMKITNSKIADYFAHSKESYPFLYRVHEINKENIKELENEIKKMSTTNDKGKFENLYNTLIKLYPSAYYDLSGNHEGLGLKHYCHGTSPLRRSADIIVEHALDVCYFNHPSDEELYLLEQDIKEKKKIVNSKNTDIEYFMTNYTKEKQKIKKKYRQNHI